jgi:ankyrin repeat protein
MQGILTLHAAARDDDTVSVRMQLSTAGALSLINTQDASGATPLYWAVQNGHVSVTVQLIEGRCNVDLPQDDGRTPLFIATQQRYAAVMKLLIEARCKVDLQMSDGRTPLYAAAESGHAVVTMQQIEANCNLNLQHENGSTPLYITAQNGHAANTESSLMHVVTPIFRPTMGERHSPPRPSMDMRPSRSS